MGDMRLHASIPAEAVPIFYGVLLLARVAFAVVQLCRLESPMVFLRVWW